METRPLSKLAEQRIFILGSNGRLGAALMKQWSTIEPQVTIGLGRAELDFSQPEIALASLKSYRLTPKDFIVNCAAMTHVDQCEENPALAVTVNATTPSLLAELAADTGARFLHMSTDYVFDGTLRQPYRETDRPNPLNRYGVSKLQAEQAVVAASPNHYVVRTSWIFGPERPSFVDQIIEHALTSNRVAAIDDKTSSPSYTTNLAQWLQVFCLDTEIKSPFQLAETRTRAEQSAASVDFQSRVSGGIYHLCNSGSCSWRDYGEYALRTAAHYGIPVQTTSVAPLKLNEMKNFIAKRPPHTALDTTKFETLLGARLRTWQEGVEEYVMEKFAVA